MSDISKKRYRKYLNNLTKRLNKQDQKEEPYHDFTITRKIYSDDEQIHSEYTKYSEFEDALQAFKQMYENDKMCYDVILSRERSVHKSVATCALDANQYTIVLKNRVLIVTLDNIIEYAHEIFHYV